jgi:hypothetical protein
VTQAVTDTPGLTASATPLPTPPPDAPPPGQVSAGGDQPSGPVPNEQGSLPEVVTNDAALLTLRDELQQEIDGYSAEVGGIDVGIAVTDLLTNETVSVGGNGPHKTGCVINLYGLFAAAGEFQAGNASPSGMEYSIKKGIGGSYPPEVKNFLDEIFGSYHAGVDRAREMMSGWGMKVSYYDHVPFYGGENPGPNLLTALESNDILTRLYHQQIFSEEWTGYILGVLRDSYEYVDYIIPKWLPGQAVVGHKIGYHWDYDGWVNNDVAIITFTGADGAQKGYAISYFSQYARSEQIGYSFGAKLSRKVWEFMAPRYGIAAPVQSWYPEPQYGGPVEPPQPLTPEPTEEPTAVPTATPTPQVTTPAPTATPTPHATPTKTPKPATATPTPVHTATPTPH